MKDIETLGMNIASNETVDALVNAGILYRDSNGELHVKE